MVGFFESQPLQKGDGSKGERNYRGRYQASNSPLFSTILGAFGCLLFYSVAFKVVHKGLDSDSYFLLRFISALAAVICAALCLVYTLLNSLSNLPNYGSNVRRQHENPLAALNSRSEDIVIETVIIAELKIGNIEVEVLFADVVESPDDAALEDAPKAFNRIGVDGADVCHIRAYASLNEGAEVLASAMKDPGRAMQGRPWTALLQRRPVAEIFVERVVHVRADLFNRFNESTRRANRSKVRQANWAKIF